MKYTTLENIYATSGLEPTTLRLKAASLPTEL